jgi:DNA-directed RNA polymerase specialized sigma subunit
MAAVTTYNVRAVRWEHGWELHIDGVGVTQSRALGGSARRMVLDYIRLARGEKEAKNAALVIRPDLGQLSRRVTRTRSQVRAAAEAQAKAAAESREVARALKDKGLSGNDIAEVLDVSPQRVSQLVS